MSWAVPVEALMELISGQASVPALTMREKKILPELYGAELTASPDQVAFTDDVRLAKIRTRSFDEIAANTDDSLGLFQILQALKRQFPFASIDSSNFRYDVYQEADSGATIVIPQGRKLRVRGTDFVMEEKNGNLGLVVRIVKNNSQHQAIVESDKANSLLLQEGPNLQWSMDPFWSNWLPQYRPGGFLVKRTGMMGGQQTFAGLHLAKYAFSTVAVRDGTMLATVAFLRRPDDVSLLKDWTHLLLGVQLSTFSHGSWNTNGRSSASEVIE